MLTNISRSHAPAWERRLDAMRLFYCLEEVKNMWIDYDKEVDVLYICFDRPQKATDSEMSKDGILYRYRGEKRIGITILEASKR